jgi:hypothetical protein
MYSEYSTQYPAWWETARGTLDLTAMSMTHDARVSVSVKRVSSEKERNVGRITDLEKIRFSRFNSRCHTQDMTQETLVSEETVLR